jgi:hypothetical protein
LFTKFVTPFGVGNQGYAIHSASSGSSGTYQLVSSDTGGSPVISYGAAIVQMSTPPASPTSGFSYRNGSGSQLSIQSASGVTNLYSNQYDTNLSPNTNQHVIEIPGGIASQKLLTFTSTWQSGQVGRSYYGKQLLTSSNTNAWDGSFTSFTTQYLQGYGSGGVTAALIGVTWLRALTDNDRAAFDENPWQIFRPNPGRLYGLPPAGGWPWTPILKVTSS